MLPPRAVLAAVDFSEASRAALVCAARLATHCHARLHVLHAHDEQLAARVRAGNHDLTAETRAELEAACAGAGVPTAGPWVLHVVFGAPDDVICHIADRERADVIAIGRQGLSGASEPAIGSTAESVLRKADVSVLVVPPDWTPPRPDRGDLLGTGPVIAAVELSEAGLTAALAGARLASMLGTTLELMHVVPPPPTGDRWRARIARVLPSHLEAARQDLAEACRGAGIRDAHALQVVSGPVAETLAVAARPDHTRHPLLLLGRRATAASGLAPAATAVRTIRLATVPVLVHVADRE